MFKKFFREKVKEPEAASGEKVIGRIDKEYLMNLISEASVLTIENAKLDFLPHHFFRCASYFNHGIHFSIESFPSEKILKITLKHENVPDLVVYQTGGNPIYLEGPWFPTIDKIITELETEVRKKKNEADEERKRLEEDRILFFDRKYKLPSVLK